MEQKKYFFQKLTPTDEVKISVYEEAIDFSFTNEDITNIAISGPYSAGKSSVIESYKEIHPDYKFVYISLAHFEDTDKKSEAENEEVRESVLEGKILNQLIHQIPVDRIPQTNFRVKRGTSKSNIVLMTILLCSLIGSAIFLSKSEKMVTFVNGLSDNWFKNILSALTGNYAAILMVFTLVISCNDIVYFINKTDLDMDFSHVEEQFGEKDTSTFYDDIAKNNAIKSSIYQKILNDIGYVFDTYDAVDLAEDKMRILIDDGLLQMSKESLEFTRTQYPKQNLYFIEHNLDAYLDIQTSDIVVHEEIVQILDLEFDDKKKIELLGFTSEEVSVQHKSI